MHFIEILFRGRAIYASMSELPPGMLSYASMSELPPGMLSYASMSELPPGMLSYASMSELPPGMLFCASKSELLPDMLYAVYVWASARHVVLCEYVWALTRHVVCSLCLSSHQACCLQSKPELSPGMLSCWLQSMPLCLSSHQACCLVVCHPCQQVWAPTRHVVCSLSDYVWAPTRHVVLLPPVYATMSELPPGMLSCCLPSMPACLISLHIVSWSQTVVTLWWIKGIST